MSTLCSFLRDAFSFSEYCNRCGAVPTPSNCPSAAEKASSCFVSTSCDARILAVRASISPTTGSRSLTAPAENAALALFSA
eukprot:CAMPEP_0172022480 /NCGR_PEP_ID=MMETSP1041-20130122/14288_1 /TAXON_ID=464988 /ORGANISM="Hemiselmis andersenii, Strain CCMP439" /LENGTH=80 /DNA_ID=CAMNT_0012677915 /DNA_START=182 /DNA_END=420 /DNA_ORIENTATION=-